MNILDKYPNGIWITIQTKDEQFKYLSNYFFGSVCTLNKCRGLAAKVNAEKGAVLIINDPETNKTKRYLIGWMMEALYTDCTDAHLIKNVRVLKTI